jgi:hypothetical protein
MGQWRGGRQRCDSLKNAAAGTVMEYFLGDALGSVRQLTNASGAITYARTYDPYGVVASTSGSSQSAYTFAGESYGIPPSY